MALRQRTIGMCLAAAIGWALVAFPSSFSGAQTLIVGNKLADTAGFIDLASGEMVYTRPTGTGPHEVAISPDGNIAAVVSYGDGRQAGSSVSLFDVPTATALKVIDLSPHRRPHGILWMPDGQRLLITTEGSGSLIMVDTEEGEVISAIKTGQKVSHMVSLSPDASIAYVTNIGSDSITVVDLEAGRVVETVAAGKETEGVAVSPDGKELWVTNRDEDTVYIFDTETFTRLATIETGSMPIRVAISPDGKHAVVSNARDGTINVIDVAERVVTKALELDSGSEGHSMPVTLLFSPDGSMLYVALTNKAQIARIETEGWQQVGLLDAGEGSDGLGYSPLPLVMGR